MAASNEFDPGIASSVLWSGPDAGTEDLARALNGEVNANARAAVVNRTHRVVRERAEQMQKQRRNVRGLLLPLAICSVLLFMLSAAAWSVFSGAAVGFGTELGEEAGKLLTTQAPELGGPGYVLFLWFLPVSAVAFGSVLLRRSRGRSDDEVRR